MFQFIKNKIEWHRMKKIVFDHPYFDVKQHRLTEQEASRLLRGHKIPNGRDVIRKAREELHLSKGDDSVEFTTGTNDFVQKKAPHTRRKIIAAASLAIILGFLVLTSTGNSWAESAYSIIVRFFNGTLLVQRDETVDVAETLDFIKLPETFASLQEVKQLTNYPIVIPSNDSRMINFDTETIGQEMIVVSTDYILSDNKTFNVTQTLHSNDIWAGAVSADQEELETVLLLGGVQGYLGKMQDGTVFIEAYGEKLHLHISSIDLSLDEMRQLASTLEYLQ